ncbi:dTDP-4-dehydrorhamnose reductase family protein [Parafrankia discariae]|uniref:dTDP-4-dehydrorhamnose reductase family protein n=1 Tax=Parafrankia discariae TaxID=365528 RepID=UPI00035D17CA|nr:SDR family oxidoreductase [Parafrankia discariae]
MRVLVLGGDGMLGGELVRWLVRDHDVTATVRATAPSCPPPADRVFTGVDVRRRDTMVDVFVAARPDAVVNAVSLAGRHAQAGGELPAIEVNALFPHRLARLCRAAGARLVHVSTDRVFSGRLGDYHEEDVPDPVDVHGMTRLLGEVREPGTLTLRTSVVGLAAAPVASGLVERFLAAKGEVPGPRRVVHSALTTAEFARFVHLVLVGHPDLTGIWHLGSEPISQFDLLTMLAERLGRRDVRITPSDGEVRNRALSARRLRSVTGYRPPGWPVLVDELATAIERRDIEGFRRRRPAPRPGATAAPRAALTSPNGVHADA